MATRVQHLYIYIYIRIYIRIHLFPSSLPDTDLPGFFPSPSNIVYFARDEGRAPAFGFGDSVVVVVVQDRVRVRDAISRRDLLFNLASRYLLLHVTPWVYKNIARVIVHVPSGQ